MSESEMMHPESGVVVDAGEEAEVIVFPMSFAQQRLWLLEQMTGGSVYTICRALRLSGTPDVEAIERSIEALVERHEILRTTFTSMDGEPVQVISEVGRAPLTQENLEEHLEREQEAIRLAHAESQRPFDLARGALLRALLIRLSDHDHLLVLTMHHIISDGWSMNILARELARLYEGYCKGEVPELDELPIQYADFATWQREWLQGDVLEGQLRYWQEQLADAEPLDLCSDRPRPPVQSFRGACESFEIPRPLTDELNTLARSQGATLFVTLLAAFQALLQRHTGQTDIVVGTPTANRNRSEIEGLIGCFVNSLALRTDLSGNPTVHELLKRARETALAAYSHQDLPFQLLVEALQPDRDMSKNPIFQVMFSLHNEASQSFELPGLALSTQELEIKTIRFDLELHLWEEPHGLRGLFVYATDLFDASSVRRMIEHFGNALGAMVANPEARILDLPILAARERRQLLEEWNETSSSYPRSACVHHLFEAQVAKDPNAVALVCGESTLTYAALNARANQLARHLAAAGVERGARVGVCLERSAELVVCLLAILKAGGAYVPFDPDTPPQRLFFMLEDTGASILLTDSRSISVLPDLDSRVIAIDRERGEIEAQSDTDLQNEGAALDSAYVIYTSGSTGRPKGICVPHRAVSRLVICTNYVDLTSSDRIAMCSNVAFDAATFEIWGALLHGGQLISIERDVLLSPSRLASTLRNHEISSIFLTTALFNQIAREVPRAFATLRNVLFGGEASDPESVRRVLEGDPPQRLLHVYGPTESTTYASWNEIESVEDGARTVPIGQPLSNTTLYILDINMQPVPLGAAGELYIGGDGLAHGYLNQPRMTAEAFVPDPFGRESGGRLYCTGDRVRRLATGAIEFIGRMDDQVKLRGFRIELGEIESALRQHPAIEDATVLLREDAPGDKRLVGYVVESAPVRSELRTFLKQRLPDYMIPSTIVALDSLPLNANGKVDRGALPAPDVRETRTEDEFVEPRTLLEQTMAGIWCEVLELKQLGIHDDFFELGGHSLLATQIVSRVRDTFQVEVPLSSLFQRPTVAGQIEVISDLFGGREIAEEVAGALAKLEGLSEEDVMLELGR